jgi:hypothetical protein
VQFRKHCLCPAQCRGFAAFGRDRDGFSQRRLGFPEQAQRSRAFRELYQRVG